MNQNINKINQLLKVFNIMIAISCCKTPNHSNMDRKGSNTKRGTKSQDHPSIFTPTSSDSGEVLEFTNQKKEENLERSNLEKNSEEKEKKESSIFEFNSEKKDEIPLDNNNIEIKLNETISKQDLPGEKKREGLEVLPPEVLNAKYKILFMGRNLAGKSRLLNKLCDEKFAMYRYERTGCTTKNFTACISKTYPDVAYIEAPPFFCSHAKIGDSFYQASYDDYKHCFDRALENQAWPSLLNYNLIVYIMNTDIMHDYYVYSTLGPKPFVCAYDDSDKNGVFTGHRAPFVWNSCNAIHLMSGLDLLCSDTDPNELKKNTIEAFTENWPNLEDIHMYGISREDYEKPISELKRLQEIEKIFYERASANLPFNLDMEEKDRKKRKLDKIEAENKQSQENLDESTKSRILNCQRQEYSDKLEHSLLPFVKEVWKNNSDQFIQNSFSDSTIESLFFNENSKKIENTVNLVRSKIINKFDQKIVDNVINMLDKKSAFNLDSKKRYLLHIIYDEVNHNIEEELLKINQEVAESVKAHWGDDRDYRKPCLAARTIQMIHQSEKGDVMQSIYKENFINSFNILAKQVINEYEIATNEKIESSMLEYMEDFISRWIRYIYSKDKDDFIKKQVEFLEKNNRSAQELSLYIEKETENMKIWLVEEYIKSKRYIYVDVNDEIAKNLDLKVKLNLKYIEKVFEEKLSHDYEILISKEVVNLYCNEYIDKYLETNYSDKIPYGGDVIIDFIKSKTIMEVNKFREHFEKELVSLKIDEKTKSNVINNINIFINNTKFIDKILNKMTFSNAYSGLYVEKKEFVYKSEEYEIYHLNTGSRQCLQFAEKYISENQKIKKKGYEKNLKSLAYKIAKEIYDKKFDNTEIFQFLQSNILNCWISNQIWQDQSSKMTYNEWFTFFLPMQLISMWVNDKLFYINYCGYENQKTEIQNKSKNEAQKIVDEFLKNEIHHRMNLLVSVAEEKLGIELGLGFDEDYKIKSKLEFPEFVTYNDFLHNVMTCIENIVLETLKDEKLPEKETHSVILKLKNSIERDKNEKESGNSCEIV